MKAVYARAFGPVAGEPAMVALADGVPLLRMAAVALAALVYYALYLRYGFLFADGGHYAQVAYELMRGTDPHDIGIGYGVLWFKIGQGLFELFGPDWRVVMLFFQTLAAVTAAAVFGAVQVLTGNALPALAAALVVGLVPAFPPTVFYGLCVASNVLVLGHALQRWRWHCLRPQDVAVPAAVLALTFQIRPDFGFVFSMPFLALLVAGAAGGTGGPGWRDRAPRFAKVALAAFAAAHLPILLDGLRDGYADLILRDYLRYPRVMLRMVWTGLSQAFGHGAAAGGAAQEAGTLLQRPPLSAVWRSPLPVGAFVALLYLPLAALAAYAVDTAVRTLRAPVRRRWGVLLSAGLVLIGAAAAVPHFFLFRPDLPHVANAMPGLAILAGVFMHGLWSGAGAGAVRTAARGGAVLIAAWLGLYAGVGLTQPGAGSVEVAAGRTQPFVARNGVDVLLTPGEESLMSAVLRTIEEHTPPGGRVGCVPFCPGIVFMSARRMLFGEYYVDDSFLLTDPGWIDRAIRRTEEARPTAVVVFDWAVNGTEISRFGNWARRYVEYLGQAAGTVRVIGPMTVYALPAKPGDAPR